MAATGGDGVMGQGAGGYGAGGVVVGGGGERAGLAEELARRLGDAGRRGRPAPARVGLWEAGRGVAWRGAGEPAGEVPAVGALVWVASPEPDGEGRALAGALEALAPEYLVVISSSTVYEPHHHHPGLVTERHPVTRRSGNPVAAHWQVVEERVRSTAAARPALGWTVLRPPPVPLPGRPGAPGRDSWNRLLCSRLAGVPVGFDPVLQFLHPEDLASAVERALERGGGAGAEPDTFHLAPTAPVPCRRGLALAGVTRIPLPRFLLAALWHRSRGRPHPDYLRHPWTVCADAARERLGWAPRHSSAAALAAATGVAENGVAENGEAEGGEGRRARLLGRLDAWDDFGLDPAFLRRMSRTVFRFLHQVWHRVEVAGLEGVPATGPAVLTGVHRGFVPLDAMLALHEISGGWRQGAHLAPRRIPRFLVHPGLLKAPFVALLVTRLGGVPAAAEHLDRLLARGEMVGVFPEGVHGAFSRYRDAHRVRPFVSDEFLHLARRHGAAVVPFVTLGSAEAFPVLGVVRWRWWKRTMEWPYIPLTPTFPWLPPVPLPTRWHTSYLQPLDPREASVAESRRRLRSLLQATLDDLRARRRSWWRGRIFPPE